MKKFIIGAFIISIILAVCISPFASSFPDGLEKVAKSLGFIHKETTFFIKSPISDYSVSFIKGERLSTSFAGLIGTVIVFILATGIGMLTKKQR